MQKNIYRKLYKSKLVYLLFIFTLLMSISGCYFPTTSSSVQHIYDQFGLNFPLHKKAYLAHDIWYENPMAISFFNYQMGKIIPFGTEIKFIEAYPDYVIFETVESKIKCKITNDPNISLLSNIVLFHQFFTTINPNTKVEKLSEDIINKLKQGKIEVGMTRDEVLLSLGPPPLNMTPKGTKVTWIYFLDNKLKTTHIVFKNNKVSYVFTN